MKLGGQLEFFLFKNRLFIVQKIHSHLFRLKRAKMIALE
jgi:hypothetical protein